MPVRDLLSAASGTGGAVDPYFYDVSLLLNGDGTNGAQNNTFLDSSTNNFTITRNGNTTQGSFSPYGSLWSNYFNGSSYLNTASNAAFGFGSGAWTLEAWVFPTAAQTDNWILMTNDSGKLRMRVGGSGYLSFYTDTGNIGLDSATVVTVNQWSHVAITYDGTTLRLYQNGVRTASSTVSISNGSSNACYVGQNSVGGSYWNGYISNARVVKGTAVYTGSTYTVPTTPLTAISGTSLLTCQSNRFIDNSSNAFAITVGGTPSVQRFSPFNPTAPYTTSVIGGSGYFGASSDYLSMSAQTAFNVSGGNWTIEFWYYRASSAGTTVILENNSNGVNGYSFQTDTSNNLVLYVNTNIITSSSSMQLNAWNHCALVRSGSTTTMYINGASVGTSSTDAGSTNGGLWIGARSGGSFGISGYMTDLRIVKGTAVYTTTFAPPTAPLTAITNTSLLENFTNAGIPDLAMMNNLQTVGNAQVSTSVKKYGTGSLKFGGSGDYMDLPSIPQYAFGSGDFTIEGWIYWDSSKATDQIFIDFRPTTTNGAYPTLFLNSSGQINFYASNGVRITSSAITTNTWTNFALVKNSGTTKLYVNGTQSGSSYTDSNSYLQSRLRLGDSGFNIGDGAGYKGYLDDIRITNGLARYTTTFTPPTAALPTY